MKSVRFALATLAAAFAFTLSAAPAYAEKAPVYTAFLSNVAVGGYDPVAYFTDGRPVRGSNAFRIVHQGFEYRFASQAHLDAFRANPSRYLPQYGGYCAWAVAQGNTASGDPRYWRIVEGRLYLNYNSDIQRQWEADIPGFIASANSNWPRVLR
jgi:YHS domain-containing protein